MIGYGYDDIIHLDKMIKEANVGRRNIKQIEKIHKKNKKKKRSKK